MSGFTKGPWNLTTSARLLNQWGVGDDLYLGAVCSDGFPVCIVVLDGLERTEAKANADILATAPELYEALVKAEGHLAAIGTPRDSMGRYHKDGEWTFNEAVPREVDAAEVRAAFEAIRAALSKAAGEGV